MFLAGLTAAALAIACSGCGAACDTSDDANPPTRYADGTTTEGIYESSPWKSGLLPFSGGKQYQLEHHLGFTPAVVQIYIAFGAEAERVALCAGNSCLSSADDQVVWIKNDTCADFWVRVVAFGRGAGSGSDASSAIDASTSFDAASEARDESFENSDGTMDLSPSVTSDATLPDASDAGTD